jgi:hypothetical protein
MKVVVLNFKQLAKNFFVNSRFFYLLLSLSKVDQLYQQFEVSLSPKVRALSVLDIALEESLSVVWLETDHASHDEILLRSVIRQAVKNIRRIRLYPGLLGPELQLLLNLVEHKSDSMRLLVTLN